MNDPRLVAIVEMIDHPQVRITGPGHSIAIDYTEKSRMYELRNLVKDAAKALGYKLHVGRIQELARPGVPKACPDCHRAHFAYSAFINIAWD